MPLYTVARRFSTQEIAWSEGDRVELDEETAAWVMRDSPGCLIPVEDETPQPARAMDEPPANRQVRKPARKRER